MLKENEAIHCPTEDLAKQVLQILHDKGYTWPLDTSLLEITHWESYKEKTCYAGKVSCCSKEHFEQKGYAIIPAEKFIADNTPFPEKFAIRVTEENREFVGTWFNENGTSGHKHFENNWINWYLHYPEFIGNGHGFKDVQDGYTEVTIGQFTAFALNKIFQDWEDSYTKFSNSIKVKTMPEIKVEIFPEKWAIKATEDTIKIIGDYFNNGGARTYPVNCYGKPYQVGSYFHSHNLSSGDSIMYHNNPGSNFTSGNVKEGFTEITFEQFKKHVLKQNAEMKTYKVTRANMQEIHGIACNDWKTEIESLTANYFGAFATEAELAESDVKRMFKAAMPDQLPTLQKIFPEYGKVSLEEKIKNLKPGDKVMLDANSTYKMMESLPSSHFDFTKPFSIVFFREAKRIQRDGYRDDAGSYRGKFTTFAQDNKTIVYTAEDKMPYILEVI